MLGALPMAEGYGLLIVLHIVLAIAWLGVDVGVFVGSHLIRNTAYSPEARYLVSRLMGYLDLSPRLAVPLTFAVGLNLAILGGWTSLPAAIVGLTWALALAWCSCTLYAFVLQHRREAGRALSDGESRWLMGYRRVDLWARWLWMVAIAAMLVSGAVGRGWLSYKLVLFAVVILLGNVLRLMPGTSSMALMAEIHGSGSTREREQALYRRLSLTHPLILAVYACVLASIFLGVLKPGSS